MKTSEFQAPWSRFLKMVSALFTVLMMGISSIGLLMELPAVARWSMTLGPLAILAGSILFVIRGYAVERGVLSVRRLFWSTNLSLAGLVSAAPEENAMSRSIRLCGNGGAFSFTGWFRNKTLGTYRAFVTDLERCVVLRFPSRTIVVSPDRPKEFAEALNRTRPSCV